MGKNLLLLCRFDGALVNALHEVVGEVVEAITNHDPATADEIPLSGHPVVHAGFDQAIERELGALRAAAFAVEAVDVLVCEGTPVTARASEMKAANATSTAISTK